MNNHSKYTDEFKQEAVNLVTQEGYSISKAAKHLGIGSTTLANWVKRASATPVLNEGEGAELKQLRKENRELRMERDILKKAAQFFAKESG